MQVYLASRFDNRDLLRACAEELEETGNIKVTSRWVMQDDYEVDNDALNDPENVRAHRIAEDDLSDIRAADLLIYFSAPEQGVRGGRHVEFGFALGLGRPIVVVGALENVFHRSAGVARYDTWDEAYKAVTGRERASEEVS